MRDIERHNYQNMAARAEELYDEGSLDVVEMIHTQAHPNPRVGARTPAPARALLRFAYHGLALGILLAAAACDSAATAVDASAPVTSRTAAVSLRIDVTPNKPASLSVLAFRAAFSGVAAADILGMVDPLAADAPRHDCQLRDVDQAAAALVARGEAIELEELAGVGVLVGTDNTAEIRPSPRLFPDLAATIGGVVGEAGPVGLLTIPDEVRVRGTMASDETADVAALSVPTTGWIRLVNGTVPRDGILIPTVADLNLNLTPSDVTETSVELRPFGATVALSCAVPPTSVPSGGQIAMKVSRQDLDALVAASGSAPGASIAAALDLVRRSGKQLPLSATRVSLEVRTSTFVELRP
jgi:hypothetical protein